MGLGKRGFRPKFKKKFKKRTRRKGFRSGRGGYRR